MNLTMDAKEKHFSITWFIIALLPVFAHEILMRIAISNHYSPTGILDRAVSFAIIIYTIVVILTLQKKEYLIRLTLIAYSFIFSIASVELFLYAGDSYMRNKFRADAVPWVPVAPTRIPKNILPGIQGRVEFSVNSYGLRGPNTDLRKNDINFLVIGGSTSECKYVTDKLSWPWRFQDSLAKKLNKKIFVGNAGRAGHFLLHHIYLLQHYKYAPYFDWIVFLASGNDIRPLVLNNYEKEKEAVPYWTLTSFEASSEPNVPYYGKSRMLKGIKTYFLIHNWFPNMLKEDASGMEIVKKRALRKNALKKNAFRKLPSSSEIEKAIIIYKDNLKKFIDICRQRHQNILILTEPILCKADMPPKLENLMWIGYHAQKVLPTSFLVQIAAKYNLATIDVCRQEHVPFIDLASMLSKDESTFYDEAHFNITGCEKVSDILADYFYNFYTKP